MLDKIDAVKGGRITLKSEKFLRGCVADLINKFIILRGLFKKQIESLKINNIQALKGYFKEELSVYKKLDILLSKLDDSMIKSVIKEINNISKDDSVGSVSSIVRIAELAVVLSFCRQASGQEGFVNVNTMILMLGASLGYLGSDLLMQNCGTSLREFVIACSLWIGGAMFR